MALLPVKVPTRAARHVDGAILLLKASSLQVQGGFLTKAVARLASDLARIDRRGLDRIQWMRIKAMASSVRETAIGIWKK